MQRNRADHGPVLTKKLTIMARIIENTVILNSGAALELEQVASICAGPFAGSRATDSQIREYLKDGGWSQDDIDEFIEFINEDDLIYRMRLAADRQDLGKLYEKQVDKNLFNEKTDYDRDATGLFFDLDENKFVFITEVTEQNGWREAFEQHNNVVFIDYINAADAVYEDLNDLIEQYKKRKYA